MPQPGQSGKALVRDRSSRPKIYDPFFTTKEPGKGTGLGLFIVRQIIERNTGRITVETSRRHDARSHGNRAGV